MNSSSGSQLFIASVRSRWQTLPTKFPCRLRCSIRPSRRSIRRNSSAEPRVLALQTRVSRRQNLPRARVPIKFEKSKARLFRIRRRGSTNTKSKICVNPRARRGKWDPSQKGPNNSRHGKTPVLEVRPRKVYPPFVLSKSTNSKKSLKISRKT